MKLLVTDPLSEEGLKILEESGIPVDVKTGLSEDELCEIIGDYDGVIIRSGTKITARVIEAGKKLKVIGRAGVGVDNVDVPAATEKGILVMNTPSANIISAAEHSMAMMLALARNIVWAHQSVHEGKWERKRFTGIELFGKTLGIVGVGRVGAEVAKRARAFGMKLIGYDPFLPEDIAESLGVRLTTLEEVLSESDIITIHTPLTPSTKNMIDREEFAMMKKSALLINVARGEIVNEDALAEALREGHIAGAAFDVFAQEPLPPCELLELPNLITTPHLGASTVEAQEKVSVEMAEHVVMFLRDGIISNAVNAPRGEVDAELAPFIPLAESLGSFAFQSRSGPVDRLEVTCYGELSSKNTRMLTLSALIGVLSNIVGDNTNIINAESIAKSKGIKVVETKVDECEHYTNMVSVKLSGSGGSREVRGTVFPGRQLRIVGVDHYNIDIPMDADFFMAVYRDGPGVIGTIGRMLGDNDVNIAGMAVAREAKERNALMLMSVDQEVPESVMEKIASLERFHEAHFIRLSQPKTYMK
ncbi:MAG: D-3-phosphoglycerate dehydrogenase / 2-oxoglutarate reductase [Candidatus Methanomethylophilaceae archaeon]|nr:D-3-phosphoglycerate dehydrogenase / 2-oxoglutarate reductase [Candidatus Methanomethylophilaceae archaeon]MDI3541448.1 D-3-phosphoglycerate dehydrogenase / 2-oxoglutarate reductase [Candidatus Methanomethylophilaceae archaeon]